MCNDLAEAMKALDGKKVDCNSACMCLHIDVFEPVGLIHGRDILDDSTSSSFISDQE